LSDVLTSICEGSIVMMRTAQKLGIASLWGVQLIPGALEKGTRINLRSPYPEPAQVPQGEKPKV
jgi:hypothetical protein